MKLSTSSRDIRFQPVGHRGCILNPYSTGILARRFQTIILLRLYFLGRALRMAAVDTTFRGDWIVIDCGIIPRAGEIDGDGRGRCAHTSRVEI